MSIFRFFILIAVVAMSLTSGNGCWALVGAVDVNGDGMLIATASDNHFAPVDKTTAEQPFLF